MNKETGIHTFSLNLKSSYTEIQNIITENEHICIKKDKFRGANEHSWTIACTSCAFSVYDKTYELEKRHKIRINQYILRLELRLKRKRIRQCTTSNHWEKQLLEISKKQD